MILKLGDQYHTISKFTLAYSLAKSSNQMIKLTLLPELLRGGGYLTSGIPNLPDPNNYLHSWLK